MIPVSNNGLPHLRFPNLDFPGLRHGIFTRMGGASKAPFESLNVGRSAGDNPDAVRENRKRIARSLKTSGLVFSHQVHGADVLHITEGGPSAEAGDAMITDLPGKFLALKVADCQPVFLFDPVRRAVGAVHSGWRGSVLNILGKTVAAMEQTFGCNPKNLFAGVGPSLGPCCAEFIHFREELPEAFHPYGSENHRFDFWAISQGQLTEAGIPKDNIHISRMCTQCRTDLFFSYRGEKVTGRFAAVIGMEAL